MRLRAAAALALLALSSPSALLAAATAADIDRLVQSGKLEDAVRDGRAAVQAKPDDPDLRLALAHALGASSRRMERIVDVNVKAEDVKTGQIVIPKYSTNTPTRLEVGYDAAPFEEALLHLSEGIRRAPQRKDLRMSQIYLLTDAAKIDRAASALREAVAALPRTPGLAEDLEQFGAERAKRGDIDGGATLLGVVATAFPQSAQVQADYSFTLARGGRKREALAAMDRAVAAAPNDLKTQRMNATVALVLRDFPRARSAYQASLAIGKQEQDRLGAAVAHYGVDPAASEEEMLALAAPAASSDPGMVSLAATFARAAKDGPASATAMDLARSLVQNKQELLAIPVLDRIMAADPAQKEAAKLLADVYDTLGCPKLASAVRPKPAPKKPAPKKPAAAPKAT